MSRAERVEATDGLAIRPLIAWQMIPTMTVRLDRRQSQQTERPVLKRFELCQSPARRNC
jgi:hypothetical protein